jgi:hypothetical protein
MLFGANFLMLLTSPDLKKITLVTLKFLTWVIDLIVVPLTKIVILGERTGNNI